LGRSIKRIIFETVHKFHSGKPQTLSISEIRQIAGRAGRYKTSHQAIEADTQEQATTRVATAAGNDETTTSDHIALDSSVEPASDSTARLDANKPISVTSSGEPESASDIPTSAQAQDELTTRAAFDEHTIGLVTTIDAADFGIVASALATEPPPLTFASIQPPPGIVQRFASYFPPGTPFSYILLRLTELSDTTSRYRIYHKNDAMVMADMIHGIEGLSIEDRMIFINAPASIREKSSKQGKLLKELATCIGSQRGGDVLSLKNLALELLDSPTVGSKPRLKELEELHKGLVLYLWLSFRFPGVFTQRPLANYTKELVESEIEETLRLMTFKPGAVRREQMRRRSVVEDEIMRIVREQEMKRDEKAGEVAVGESGFESAAAEPIASESGEGESMPVDDEGAYPEEEEGEAVEASAQDENASSNAKGTSGSANDDAKNASLKEASSFSEWRDKAQQSLHQEKTESVAVEGDEPVSRDAQEENEGKQKASG
jgi:ATP-dependent RNA helicase SUPV3L1/SUV3